MGRPRAEGEGSIGNEKRVCRKRSRRCESERERVLEAVGEGMEDVAGNGIRRKIGRGKGKRWEEDTKVKICKKIRR